MPPTSLGNFPRRWLDSNTIGSRAGLRAEEARRVACGPPYGGYTPDLVAGVSSLGDGEDVHGLIPKGGGLTHDDGWAKVDSARLPLGAASLPSSTAQALTGLFMSFDPTVPSPVRLAVTCRGSDTLARLYELSASNGQWTHRAAQDAARDMDASTAADALVDWAYFPPATSAASAKTGCAVFTDNSNQIMRYPSSASTTTYDIFDQSGTYKAKSVEVSEDRVLALNVDVPTDGRIMNRLIWTNKGAAASFNLSGTGAGRADFIDIKGQGLAVKNLGQLVVLYFDSAVVILERTGIATDPFRRRYTSEDRGLLSTHSVVKLGSGVHFGLFTDGWFFFDEQTRWEEAGVRTTDGGSFHKWHKTFYELLDWDNRDRVVCAYDAVNRFVRISFPTRGNSNPNLVWTYDLLTDTVWPDENYGSNAPNCWGRWFDIAETGTTIDNLPGDIDDLSSPIDSYSPTRGRERLLHGTIGGNVFRHDPFLVSQDGSLPVYRYQSKLIQVGGTHLQKTGKRLVVGYKRIQPTSGDSPSPITAVLRADSGQSSQRSIPQTKGAVSTTQTDWVAGQVSGIHLGWDVSGVAPVEITSTDMLVTVLGRNIATDT
jgi:hypothetical protein